MPSGGTRFSLSFVGKIDKLWDSAIPKGGAMCPIPRTEQKQAPQIEPCGNQADSSPTPALCRTGGPSSAWKDLLLIQTTSGRGWGRPDSTPGSQAPKASCQESGQRQQGDRKEDHQEGRKQHLGCSMGQKGGGQEMQGSLQDPPLQCLGWENLKEAHQKKTCLIQSILPASLPGISPNG